MITVACTCCVVFVCVVAHVRCVCVVVCLIYVWLCACVWYGVLCLRARSACVSARCLCLRRCTMKTEVLWITDERESKS